MLLHCCKKMWGFFFSFLCLSAISLMIFLVSPYCDLLTQCIVSFLVSRFSVCHLSVLALAPASPGSAPESLLTCRDDSSLVSLLAFTILAASRACLVCEPRLSHSWV